MSETALLMTTPVRSRPTSLLFIAAIAAPLTMFLAVSFFSFGQIKSDAELRVSRTAQVLSEHALRTFREHDLVVSSVAKYVQGWTWTKIAASRELYEFLAGFVDDIDDINTAFLAGPDGRQVNTSITFPAGDIDVSDRPFFRGPRDKDELYISAPDVGRITRQQFFSFTRRRPSPGAAFDGIISVSVNPNYFSAFYQQILETPEDSVALVRSDGVLLVRTSHTDMASEPANSGLMNAIAVHEESGVLPVTSAVDGRQRLLAYRRVGNYPVFVSYGLSYSSIWAAWRRNMLPYAVVCLLAMGLQPRTELGQG